MKRLIIILLLINIKLFSFSQTFDRPGISTSTDIVGLKILQFESGIDDNSFSNLVRYGISNNYEIRIQPDYLNSLSKIYVGSKIKIIDKIGIIPNISTMFNFTLPMKNKYLDKSLFILISNSIDKFNFCYNYGISNNDHFLNKLYSFSIEYNLYKFGYFIEYYGESNTNSNLDYGITFTENCMQFDISSSLNPVFINIGFSYGVKIK